MSAVLIQSLLWTAFAFLCGSLPLSLWIGRLALGVDIRNYGDGNPGAANVFRAGGKYWGTLALLADFLKGVIPVALAQYGAGISSWSLAAVALAPIFGHAYSPFLGGRGGKALTVSFGSWCGLTLWEVPSVLGIALAVWLALLSVEGWAVVFGMLTLLIYLLVFNPDPVLLVTWIGNALLLGWTHRTDLTQKPALRRKKTRNPAED